MRELKLMSLHTDGNHVVLGDSEGQKYILRIDEPLRDAVRRDRTFKSRPIPVVVARPGAAFSPREVQDRIRSGLSAETVAQILGYDLEKVNRFAPPVLAERERYAALARAFAASRAGSPALETVVKERLHARGINDAPRWDAWKREDGWVLQLQFSTPDEDAEALWRCNFESHTLLPENEVAAWLSDQSQDAEERMFRRHLAAVRNWVYDDNATARDAGAGYAGEGRLHHGVDGVTPTNPIRVQLPSDQLERDDMLAELGAQRGVRPETSESLARPSDLPVTLPHALTAPESGPAAPKADSSSTAPTSKGAIPQAEPEAPESSELLPTTAIEIQKDSATSTGDTDGIETTTTDTGTIRTKKRTRPARSSVPSWDEIVFGTRGSGD